MCFSTYYTSAKKEAIFITFRMLTVIRELRICFFRIYFVRARSSGYIIEGGASVAGSCEL